MCVSPITRPNPWYKSTSKFAYLHDTTSQTIGVPCGHCSACIARAQLSIVQRSIMESVYNHIFYCTLTYNNTWIPYLTASSGYRFRYAEFDDVQNLFNRLRNDNVFERGFRYLCVSERGAERGRPHFHIMFFVPKSDSDTFGDCRNMESKYFVQVLERWYKNLGSSRSPQRFPLLTYKEMFIRGKLFRNYDLHYVNPNYSTAGISPVAFYCTKYLLKKSDYEERLQIALKLNLPEAEYRSIWSQIRSGFHSSRFFGLNAQRIGQNDWTYDDRIVSYLRWCVQKSKGRFDYPCFINPINGLWFPLSQFYKGIAEIYNEEDAKCFKNSSDILDREFISWSDSLKYSLRKDFYSRLCSTDYFSNINLNF